MTGICGDLDKMVGTEIEYDFSKIKAALQAIEDKHEDEEIQAEQDDEL